MLDVIYELVQKTTKSYCGQKHDDTSEASAHGSHTYDDKTEEQAAVYAIVQRENSSLLAA